MNNVLKISSHQGEYPVMFYPTIEEALSRWDYKSRDYFVIADEKIFEMYRDHLCEIFNFPTFCIRANENSKTLNEVSIFIEWLISNGATKSSTILAIGGGIIQDIATFTAHVYKRGIKWEYIPTTLLSQSDSCIGAKCGINVHPYKNQIGVLHSPTSVLIVTEFLKTLNRNDFISGYGEIIKLSLTPPNLFYNELQESIRNHGFKIEEVLNLIQLSLNSKKAIIEIDEYENDLRRILNYGHSFGHALEAVSKNQVSHGYAVVFGIDLINYLSTKWGLLDKETYQQIQTFLKENFLINFLPKTLNSYELVEALRTDKKVSSGVINFAVLTSNMNLEVFAQEIDEKLQSLVKDYLENECIFTTD